MTRWEYLAINGNPRTTTEAMNELGADGWELVAVGPRGDCLVYYFKRPGSAS